MLEGRQRARIAFVLDARQAVEVTATYVGNLRARAVWLALPRVPLRSKRTFGGVLLVIAWVATGVGFPLWLKSRR